MNIAPDHLATRHFLDWDCYHVVSLIFIEENYGLELDGHVKRSSETNRKNKNKQKWFHCAGTRSVADIHEEEEKLKSLKSAQPPTNDSTPHHVAARNDTYTQVLGPDRPSRVSGVGTGPTPTSMWGNESKEVLRTENRLLMQRMEELETTMAEKFSKMESMIRGSQDLGGITGGSHLLQTIRENLCGCVPYWQVRLGIKHVKGMLLYGPPSTGKTLMARQIVKLLNGREPKACKT
ncbi:hypothetical protein Taro_022862 [Colocasia esculenta]|uniref:Vesicle-fusing ATPase n=1 Tax=Colocasia esculenta TaxID=4460 RepID=A0A843V956_COLES|nr:hypothetical protein [Colocasia esculenta]